MEMLAGTSGFSYKEWKGTFYPEDLPAGGMLSYYASQLPAVEINNTFYRLPRASVLESWADQVGESFRFVLKASRRITHFKRLKGAEEETDYLLRTAASLGDRLGAVLFQLPPNLKADLDALDAFLTRLGDPGRAAFEFRHASWFVDATYECLRAHGSALCVADGGGGAVEVVRTAPWGYLRLRDDAYDDEALSRWARRIGEAGWEKAFVFFKHEDGGAGPAMAQRFMEFF